MKNLLVVIILSFVLVNTSAQNIPEHIRKTFPENTIYHQNIPYASDTLKKHLLDIYLPAAGKNFPLIVWIHGGAWMLNDKYADMGYMTNTLRGFIEKGYAVASIDYRHSTTAIFPAQIQDCNQALQFLYDNSDRYKIDRSKIALIGFSAGGHLASLLALSHNNTVNEFYPSGKKPSFNIKAVLDFYGPSHLILFFSNADVNFVDDPIAILLGASPLKRPDLAKLASPVTYVDKNDPPFLIIQGEKDDSVPVAQSVLLKSYLDLAGVKSELHVVKDAPHYGVMFDTPEIREKLFRFLDESLK